jgi:UDP-N-acetylglucosamine--N-acetylmuramyl-(pentapeptide) pyrophosphoryl-undecaprenol N-acetylglucosamine transferase
MSARSNTLEPVIVFAGGGSGGHISPGLAVAERLAERDEDVRCLFICSDRPIDAHMLERAGASFAPVPARPPSTRPRAVVRFVRAFRRSRSACVRLLETEQATHVVAMGGFVSAPAVSAARAARVPVTLVNLDEPPGRANRWIARRCNEVWSAVDLPERPGFATRTVGLPVRRCAIASGDAATCRARLGLEPDRRTLLVTGASQGSTSLNRFVTELAASRPDAFRDWQILHLAGSEGVDDVTAAYERSGTQARVEPFLDEIGLAWGAATLSVSRAGANSVAEVAANAVPTLFLPYPFHRDMHQRRNAQPLVDAGGAAVADDRVRPEDNVATAGPVLVALMSDADALAAMRTRLTTHRPPDAADAIAGLLLDRVTRSET